MLILTRKHGEKIFIGSKKNKKEIEITILENYGRNVRVGINAPKDRVILREEVLERMEEDEQSEIGDI